MGTAISRNLDLSTNEYLQKFVGKESISINDPFWNRFLAFNVTPPTTTNDQLVLENRIEPLCQQLLKNNLNTGNLGILVQIFLVRCGELLSATTEDANVFSWQLFNTLFTLRCILKFLTETVSEEQLIEQVESKNTNDAILEDFVGSLIGLVTEIGVNEHTYAVHLEAVTCLLILLSVQYHSEQRSDQSTIYCLFMRGKHVIHAPVLIKCLLQNYVNQEKLPPTYGGVQGQSLVLGLAAELWSIITFNRKSNEDLVIPDQGDYQQAPLATQSLLLVLVLVHHWTMQSNPYRASLFSCVNNEENGPMLAPTNEKILFKIEFNNLYTTLCKKVSGDASTLLLYLLLHRNQAFKSYLLKRLDLDQLIIPTLKTLYNAPNSNSHHIYMSLIILLILSEDESFNRMIHETKLKNISWYTERSLTEISLGGLLILIVIRTIQYNMLKMRDKYLHTNCLAALANMSSQFRDLHPYVSQRLVSLFETIAKKYQRLLKIFDQGSEKGGDSVAVPVSPNDSDMEQDINVLEEVMRMVLEILNSCLSTQLSNNPNLIYTLLYNKHIFIAFKDKVVFQDIIHNIDIIINYFSDLLVEKQQQNEVDPQQVLLVIQEGTKHWPRERFTKFPDLKFKYVEEEQPEEFFIPYVWALVSQLSILHWTNDSSAILTNASAVC